MDGHRLFRGFSIVAFLATYITLLSGGNVMASDSGLACPDWPTCSGSLLGPLTGSTGIEWSHRLSALALSLVILAVTILAVYYESRRPILRNLALAAMGTVLAQALLGGLVVERNLAVGLVLAHLTLATALFAITLLLAILSNLRTIPKAWIEWAWRASADQPVGRLDAAAPPVPTQERVPGIVEASSTSPEL
jgi:heme A synthase